MGKPAGVVLSGSIRLVAVILCVVWLSGVMGFPARRAEALTSDVASALAEEHLRLLYGFDSLEAYEVRSLGRDPTRFAVARSWTTGNPEVLIDIVTPILNMLGWSALVLPQLDRSADSFVYIPFLRRVRRMSALPMEVQPAFAHYQEFRPIRAQELYFERLEDEEIEGELCAIVEAVPRGKSLSYSHLTLAFSPRSPIARRTVYYESGSEVRRVFIDPEELEHHGEHTLIQRRVVELPGGEVLEIRLRNALVDMPLPEGLFDVDTLKYKRLPRF